jgi:hypothetical protein
VHLIMAMGAERDEVHPRITTGVTAEVFMVNFQVGHRPAGLTAPAIALQHLLPQLLVCDRIESQAWGLWANRVHAAASLRFLRKACFWSSGRKRKNLVAEYSRVSGSPLSRLAPARKSAQIISRQ